MFDISKIQEEIIYNAVKAESNDETAQKNVRDDQAGNPTWVKNTMKSKTWFQYTTGYNKVLFEKAFGCEVEVELLKSIKMGDEICLMSSTPLENH